MHRGKNIVYIRFSTTHGFRHPLGACPRGCVCCPTDCEFLGTRHDVSLIFVFPVPSAELHLRSFVHTGCHCWKGKNHFLPLGSFIFFINFTATKAWILEPYLTPFFFLLSIYTFVCFLLLTRVFTFSSSWNCLLLLTYLQNPCRYPIIMLTLYTSF